MAGPALDDTLGAALIGNIVSACLYGLTTLQTFTFYNRSHRDKSLLKTLIGILWLLDTLHLAFISHTVYIYVVKDFGDLISLLNPTWTVLAQVIVTGVSDAIVRSIFCYRIWILSDHNILVVSVLAASSLVAFGCSIAFPIEGFKFTTFLQLDRVSWILYLGLSTVALSDLLVSAALCMFLSRKKSHFESVNGVMRTIMLYSINTCALTSLCALAALVAYAASPHTFIYIAFYFLLPKLFLNSLLATLNARRSLREHLSGGDAVTIPLSSEVLSRDAPQARSFDAERFSQAIKTPRNASTVEFSKGGPAGL